MRTPMICVIRDLKIRKRVISLADTVELVKLLKKVAIEAMESKKLTNVVFGKVVSVNPLKINVEQKVPLTKHKARLKSITYIYLKM